MSLAADPSATARRTPASAAGGDASTDEHGAPQASWVLRRGAPIRALEQTMAAFDVSAPVAQVLWGRGIQPEALASERTLNPSTPLRKAAQQLARAIRAGKRIRVHGDYDADGITASATLMRAIEELGGDVHAFIPHRIHDGYGVNKRRLAEHIEACDLLITVDCGVTAVDEVRAMLDAGLEVIVTDHHARGPKLPECLVVHPITTDVYDPAIHNLTGAGVAYHLAWALRQEMREELESRGHHYGENGEPLHLAPIATIGTIADVAPLLGENRALCLAGLAGLRETAIPGLQALLGPAEPGVQIAPSARDVAFGLAPKINAAGRMGECEVALELLMTDDPARAAEILEELSALNDERKVVQDRMYEQSLALVDEREQIIVVSHPDWNAGVMGIVASKLLERFGRPVFIIAQGKGSARSTPGISAYEALKFCDDLLVKWGGHPGAAGFSVNEENIEAFRARLQEFAAQFPTPELQVQLDTPLSDCDHLGILEELDGLEPFGHGFPHPVWHLRATPEEGRLVGKNKQSLQLTLQGVRGIKHGHTSGLPEGRHDAAVSLGRNAWKGRVSPQWQCESLRALERATDRRILKVDTSDLEDATRDRLAAVAGRVKRIGMKEAATLLAQPGWVWSAQSQAMRARLSATAFPEAGREGEAPGAGVICFDVPDAETLRGWLRERRELRFAFDRPVLEDMLQTHSESHDPSRRREQAEAYHLYRWAQNYLTLTDEAFATDVLSLSGALPAPRAAVDHHEAPVDEHAAQDVAPERA